MKSESHTARNHGMTVVINDGPQQTGGRMDSRRNEWQKIECTDYAIILQSGEFIGASYAEFPARLLQRLLTAQDDPERVTLLTELLAFYRTNAPNKTAEQDWVSLPACVSDLERRSRLMLACGLGLETPHFYSQAAAVYRELIRLEPVEHKVWYYAHNNLGYCLNQLREFAGAEIYCRTALRIDAELPNAHKNLGLSLQGQGRLTEAARAFIAGTLAYPGDKRSLTHLRSLVHEHPEIRDDIPTLDADIRRCVAGVAGVN
jgi:tetratricopeptide (TPR) repeat protein